MYLAVTHSAELAERVVPRNVSALANYGDTIEARLRLGVETGANDRTDDLETRLSIGWTPVRCVTCRLSLFHAVPCRAVNVALFDNSPFPTIRLSLSTSALL